MKVQIWTVITDGGDGSHSVSLYPTEALARENLDEDDFYIYDKGTEDEWKDDVPSEVDWEWFDITDCVKRDN